MYVKYHRRLVDKLTIQWIEKLLDKPLDNFRKSAFGGYLHRILSM
jgi:hypothetical protein